LLVSFAADINNLSTAKENILFYIIYETTNKLNGMKYRGCHSTPNIEDDYLGSGSYFKRALALYGKDNFHRDILYTCNSIEEMIEKEAEYVNAEWVSRKDTYNLQTGGLSYGVLCESSKLKIANSVSAAHKTGKYDYSKLKDKKPWNKGKTNIYGQEQIEKWKIERKGKEPWNKGLTGIQEAWNKGIKMAPMSEEEKKKRSIALKKRYETHEHHLKGKEPHNKGKKTGKPSWNSGATLEKNIVCPHCDTLGASLGNMKRWHFDNCKNKPNAPDAFAASFGADHYAHYN
jgi:hypothetical protein